MLLFMIFLMIIALAAAYPVLQTQIKRELEEELIFRGRQIVKGIELYRKKNSGKLPSSLQELVEQKCIRRLWRDPMTEHGYWYIAVAGVKPNEVILVKEQELEDYPEPKIIGVASQSREESVREFQGKRHYNEWLFLYGKVNPSKIKVRYWEQGLE